MSVFGRASLGHLLEAKATPDSAPMTSLSSDDLDDLLGGNIPVAPAKAPAKPPSVATRGVPGADRQKKFITENANILNKETKLAILSIIMLEVGPDVVKPLPREVDVDLDQLAVENPEVLSHIYNIVRARLEELNTPARPGAADRGSRV